MHTADELQTQCRPCALRHDRIKLHARPYNPTLSKDEAIFSGPFFRWFDGWLARHHWQRTDGLEDPYATPIISPDPIMRAVGSSERALCRARKEGRISRALVDRILVLLDAEVQLWELEA